MKLRRLGRYTLSNLERRRYIEHLLCYKNRTFPVLVVSTRNGEFKGCRGALMVEVPITVDPIKEHIDNLARGKVVFNPSSTRFEKQRWGIGDNQEDINKNQPYEVYEVLGY